MIDVTGLGTDLMRLTDKLVDYIIGKYRLAPVGGRTPAKEISRASIENSLLNEQHKRKKEAIYGK